MIDEQFITGYITSTFENVETTVNLGYTFFFYRDDHMHAFATIASTGNEYEKISNLDRPGVYRLNIGLSRDTFQALFGKGRINVGDYDFTAWTSSCLILIIHHSISSVCFPQAKPLSMKKSVPCWQKRMMLPGRDITSVKLIEPVSIKSLIVVRSVSLWQTNQL